MHLLLHKTPNSVSSEPGAAHMSNNMPSAKIDLGSKPTL
jgi:hypothetical protein